MDSTAGEARHQPGDDPRHGKPEPDGAEAQPTPLSTPRVASPGANRLPVLAEEIRAAHEAHRRSTKEAVAHAIEAGHRLREAKKLVRHGGWEGWLRANAPAISVRTAQRYMRAATGAGESDSASFSSLRALVGPAWEHCGYLCPNRVLVLTPSDHLGFTHFTVFEIDTGLARGFVRPVADHGLKMMLDILFGLPWPERWRRKRSRPHRRNPQLEGSESDPQARRVADAMIAASERRTAERRAAELPEAER
jgi:hypothetical protein